MKKLFFNILPYLISTLFGAVIFVSAEFFEKDSVSDLLVNVAAGLLSLPLIFICYEFVKSATSAKLNKAMREHFDAEIRRIMRDIIESLKQITPPLPDETLNDYLDQNKASFAKRHIIDFDTPLIFSLKRNLDSLLVSNKHSAELIPSDELRAALEVSRTVGVLLSQKEIFGKQLEKLKKPLFELFQSLNRWVSISESLDIIEGSANGEAAEQA